MPQIRPRYLGAGDHRPQEKIDGMIKENIYIYSALFFFAPFVASLISLSICKRIGLFEIPRRYPFYVLCLGFVYYGAFFFGEYLIPILNTQIYDMHAKAMGAVGLLQDFVFPLFFAFPAYCIVNKLLGVSSDERWKNVSAFSLYYLSNFIIIYIAIKPFSESTY